MNEYFQSYADEFLSKFRRLNNLISHSGSIGNHHETIVRSFLKQFLSKRFGVKTGFVFDPKSKSVSKQIDILIVDENSVGPYYFVEDDFVVTKPEPVCVAIEIKSRLTKKEFESSVENCVAFKKVVPNGKYICFAFDTDVKDFQTLANWYAEIPREYHSVHCYPIRLYSMNLGSFELFAATEGVELGHYFTHPIENTKSVETMVISDLLATIIKMIDRKLGLKTNPFEEYSPGNVLLEEFVFRYSYGLTPHTPKLPIN